MQEEWKNIIDYEGLYQVSNLGRVKSLNYKHTGREKILKSSVDKIGYMYVGLCKNGKRKHYLVHRLVAEVFISNPNNLAQVNHKDENKHNNCVENLEWCDAKYNINYGTATERRRKTNTNHPSYSKVVLQYDLNGNFIKEWPSTMEVQRQLGIRISHISECCKGGYFCKKRNKWVNVSQAYGFKWAYKKEDY